MSWYEYLLPYDFSPLTLIAFVVVLTMYLQGLLALSPDERPGALRVVTFLLGVLLCYTVMHTRFDYYAQYMFFIHRGQHLVLHHLGPLLMVLSNPLPIMRFWARRIPGWLAPVLWPVKVVYRVLQQPLIAATLFVGLIYLWLMPELHFDAMLSRPLYWLMNGSMLLDGLLFWWLVLDPRSPHTQRVLGYGMRIILLVLVIPPQSALGAWILFSRDMIYDVYEVCGRAWPMAPQTDQMLGGILTWIPPAMMSGIAILIVIGRMMHDDRNSRNAQPAGDAEEVRA